MKVGIIVPDLAVNDRAFQIIKSVNKLVESGSKDDFVIFYENNSLPVVQPLCATMNLAYAWSFSGGIMISTTLSNTYLLSKACTDALKVFFVYDLEFVHGQNRFLANLSIFRTPSIRLVCPSEQFSLEVENYSGRKADAIIERFDVGTIIDSFSHLVGSDSRRLRFGYDA